MQKILKGKAKHILIICMSAILVFSAATASIMSGCGENSDKTKETEVIKETQVVTSIIDATYATDSEGNTVVQETQSQNNDENSQSSSSKGDSSANSGSSPNSSSNSSNNSNSDKQNSSVSNNNSGNNDSGNTGSNNSNSSSSSSNTHKPVTDSNACYIDGEKFAEGDTVTCVYKLTTPEKLENYQATISYDTKYLSVKSAYLGDTAMSGGILNYNLNGKIKFNGSSISKGYDYTKDGDFVIVNYEIKSKGKTTTSCDLEVATGFSGKSYAENNKPANGLKLTKSYS